MSNSDMFFLAFTLNQINEKHVEQLEKRLKHLFKSEFIRSFDEWDQTKNDYKRDIKEADLCLQIIKIEREPPKTYFGSVESDFLTVYFCDDGKLAIVPKERVKDNAVS